MSFDGASVYNTGDFVTPLGKVPVNREISKYSDQHEQGV